jgi:N-acetylglucosaminyldiphosphoundecaprenol N-acetyl-beta-D-mannosaminyltransferase
MQGGSEILLQDAYSPPLAGLSSSQGAPSRFGIFGTYIHGANINVAERLLHNFVTERRPRQLVTVNVDFLRIAETMPELKEVINSADLAVPDGRPLVWMARYLGIKDCDRVTGPDLIEAAAALSMSQGTKLFFLGGTPGAVKGAKRVVEERYPGVNVCGVMAPPEASYPFPEELDGEICDAIRAAQPDVLFVGFGCPKQDLWIRDHLQELSVPVSVGIGGSFNFLAGHVSRAPVKLQHLGLEWVYRLWQEPRRLWRRYLVHDLPFVARLAMTELVARFGMRRIAGLRLKS